MRVHCRTIAIWIVCLAAGSAAAAGISAQEPISPDDQVIRLFNGKDLEGWHGGGYTFETAMGRLRPSIELPLGRDAAGRVATARMK